MSDIEKAMMVRARQEKKVQDDAGRDSLTICYLVGVILAILVLVSVIVILTVITTDNKVEFV